MHKMRTLMQCAKQKLLGINKSTKFLKNKKFDFSKDNLNNIDNNKINQIAKDSSVQPNLLAEGQAQSVNDNENIKTQSSSDNSSNANTISSVSEDFPNIKEAKTRKEEVMFYIMHDKFSVKPDKEYRISHTTVESTDLKTKDKDLNVLYYGNNKNFIKESIELQKSTH